MSSKQYSKVQFHFLSSSFSLKDRTALKSFILKAFSKYNKKLDNLNFIFCTDDYLLSINQQFLQHDYYTDIITFDLSEKKEIIGEIYISIDRVRDNALKENNSFKEELHRVIFHGVLHLCGFKDKSKSEITEMRKHEQILLNLYFN